MKARIIREPRCALLWRIDESYPNYAAIARAARRYDVKLRPVADGDLGGIVGDLCAGRPAPAFAPLIALPDRPAIIVSGLRHDNGELGAFLDLIKMGGASIPVRSMVTVSYTHLDVYKRQDQHHSADERVLNYTIPRAIREL